MGRHRVDSSETRTTKKKAFSAPAKRTIVDVAEKVAAYYDSSGRHFPWRGDRDSYRLAIAEVLLQKTRAESVVLTYLELTREYPDAASLASESVDEIASRLRPLGLSNKRATSLRGMAEAIVMHGVHIFSDWKFVLRNVPGLGAYAARAIACFAGGERVGIVDANVARIVRRIFRVKSRDSRATIYQRYADAIAEASPDVEATNFGLLDLGAEICLPTPRCIVCPLDVICAKYGVKKRRCD